MASANLAVSIGDVVYLRCTLCNPPKPKYFIVAQVQPLRLLIINSQRTPFADARPRFVAATPVIFVDKNPFLDYDSVVSCDSHPSHEYSYEQLEKLLADNPTIKRGHLHIEAKRAIVGALIDNHLMPQKYVRELLPLWEDAIS